MIDNQPRPALIDAAAVAELLGVKLQWVRDHCTRIPPIIPHTRIGPRTVRFELDEVLRFVREQREERPTWERPRKAA